MVNTYEYVGRDTYEGIGWSVVYPLFEAASPTITTLLPRRERVYPAKYKAILGSLYGRYFVMR